MKDCILREKMKKEEIVMIVEEIQIGEFSSVFLSLLHATHSMVVQYECMTLN